jgi:hypothetical protein
MLVRFSSHFLVDTASIYPAAQAVDHDVLEHYIGVTLERLDDVPVRHSRCALQVGTTGVLREVAFEGTVVQSFRVAEHSAAARGGCKNAVVEDTVADISVGDEVHVAVAK